MFADPAALTINSVAKNLIRINQDGYSSEYLLRSATGEHRLRIRNTSSPSKQDKTVIVDYHNVELTEVIYAVPGVSRKITRKAWIVLQNEQGDTLTDPVNLAVGLFSWLTASSAANLTKLVNFES